MTQQKKGKQKVPPTKLDEPSVINLTKTQKELFNTKRNEINEKAGAIMNYMSQEILGKLVDQFIVELNIDVENQDWQFDARLLRFNKVEK